VLAGAAAQGQPAPAAAPPGAGWSAGARGATRGLRVRPIAVLRGSLVLMWLGNLGRIPLLATETKEAPLLVNELLLLLTLAVAAVACLQARALRADGVVGFAAAFAAVGAGSAVASAARYGLSGLELALSLAYLARWLAYAGLYVVVLNAASDDDAEPLWRTLERVVLAFALFGVFQSLFLPGFAQMVQPEGTSQLTWDRQGRRLVSTLLDPNFAGALVLIALLVQLARVAYGDRVARWKPLLLLAAVFMTVSRSTVLALFVGGLVILAARGLNRRLLRVAGLAAVLTAPFLPLLVRFAAGFNKFSIDESAMDRTVSWLRALTVIADHPVFGVGFNTYGFVARAYGWDPLGSQSYGLDGGLLFVTVMTGAVGLALYLAMLVLVVRRCRRVWRDASAPPAARGTALGAAAATAALVVHSVFVNSLLLPFIMQPLWILWGVVFLHRRAQVGRRLAPAARA
jgi:O-antigen ligase